MKSSKATQSKNKKERIVPSSDLKPVSGESMNRLSIIMAVICAAIGFILYFNTIGHDYAIDDDMLIQKNSIVTKGITAIPEIFTTSYRAGFWDRKEPMYRPLSLVMFAMEYQMVHEPWLGHLMNILIYSLTGFILFFTLRIILSSYDILIPFFAAILFIAHPLHTEVVANIKSRDELLSFLFLILSLFLLFKYYKTEGRKIKYIVSSLSCFLLALLSKESAITFVVIYPLALFFFTDLKRKKILRYSLLFLIPLAAYFMLRYIAIGTFTGKLDVLPINNSLVTASNEAGRIATAIFILGKYLSLLVFPHPLSFDYSINQIPNVSFGNLMVVMCIIIYAALLYFAIKNFKRKNIISFCILFFVITISLVSNLVFMIESTMAERFLYTSSLAFSIAAAFLIVKFVNKKLTPVSYSNLKTFFSRNKKVSLFMLLIFSLYSFKTVTRNTYWKDNMTLLRQDIKASPNSCRIQFSYGGTLLLQFAMKEKDRFKKELLLDDVIEKLEKGIATLPTFSDAYFHLGIAYNEKKNYVKAAENFEAAKRSKEWSEKEFFVSSGLANHMTGQCSKAVADYQRAVELDPKNSEAYSNWGLCLTESGKGIEALQKLDSAVLLSPEFATAWYNRGNAFARLGRYDEAIKNYEKTLSIDPAYVDALNNIGNCFGAMQKPDMAVTYFEKVLAIDPNNFNALNNLVVSYRLLGNTAKAEEYRKMLPM